MYLDHIFHLVMLNRILCYENNLQEKPAPGSDTDITYVYIYFSSFILITLARGRLY